MATKESKKEVKGNEPTVIEWLEGAKHHKPGTQSIVHRIQAEKFIERKLAKEVK